MFDLCRDRTSLMAKIFYQYSISAEIAFCSKFYVKAANWRTGASWNYTLSTAKVYTLSTAKVYRLSTAEVYTLSTAEVYTLSTAEVYRQKTRTCIPTSKHG